MYRIVRYQQPRNLSLYAGRNPWTGLETEIDRLFESALADLSLPAAPRFPVDVYEDKDNTYVRAELPGINRDEIHVEMVDGFLTISTNRKDGDRTFTFNRSVTIPEAVQADKVSAGYENGILTVTLPKQEQAKPRKITVAIK